MARAGQLVTTRRLLLSTVPAALAGAVLPAMAAPTEWSALWQRWKNAIAAWEAAETAFMAPAMHDGELERRYEAATEELRTVERLIRTAATTDMTSIAVKLAVWRYYILPADGYDEDPQDIVLPIQIEAARRTGIGPTGDL